MTLLSRLPLLLGAALALLPPALTALWMDQAADRLALAESSEDDQPRAAVAQAADATYCNPELKRILRRVLQSCGLLGSGGGRGCQPLEARKVAALSGEDFNALFLPMAERAAIIQFDLDSAELDEADRELLDEVFADQRGASYFFVVARSSPEGSPDYNRQLSQARGEAVLAHLRERFDDPDLDREVGLLWLGEEFAQLDDTFCTWRRSGPPGACSSRELNRSAFVAWIDCRL